MADTALLTLTIAELAPKIRARQVSPVEVTAAALAQADRLQPTLRSFITLLHDQAMDEARKHATEIAHGEYRGPLHGIPIGIKDNLATANIRTTVGSKVLVLASHIPTEDAEVVRRCKAAGATSNNPHYGAVQNPLRPSLPAKDSGQAW